MAARKADINPEEFAALEADNWTRTDLATHFNVHPATIDRRRKELGIVKRRPMDAERKAKITAMLDDGWSFKEISRTEGAHPETLRIHFPGRAWTGRQRAEYQATLRLVETPTYAAGATVLGIRDIAASHLASERKGQREYRKGRAA